MSFFHHSRTSKSPITRKLSRKQPPSSEGLEENGHNGRDSNDSSIAPSSPIGDEEGRKTLDSFPLPQQQQQEQEIQQQQPASFRKNDNFKPKQVAEGTGAFANGEAQHEISSKKDYELCKEQVEKGQSRQEVLEHFKLVKDLKPLDAPESMDKEIDNTKSPTK